MLEKLFFFWRGYLIIELCGESKERFLNLCKNNEIELLHIFSMKGHLYCKLCAKEYKKLHPFIKKTNCYPKIKKKVGIPFLLHHLKQRKGLIIGSILFILIVIVFSILLTYYFLCFFASNFSNLFNSS